MIPYLSHEDILDPQILENIYKSKEDDYYWSDDFSTHFYTDLAKRGFITIAMEEEGVSYLIPEMQFSYALLDHHALHISSKVKALLRKNCYYLSINTHLDEIISRIQHAYEDCWLDDAYACLLHALHQSKIEGFELIATALLDAKTNQLVAGEIGYCVKEHYVGVTKFSQKEEGHNNVGTLQRVLLTRHLSEQKGVHLSNLGQTKMPYKLALGARIYSRKAFLKRCGFDVRLNLV